jgi:hypothetical protein
LYYDRAVDPTVLMPLNDIATEQTKATGKTQATKNQLLDYLATHPDATIRYHASDMILYINSYASYLSVSNSRIRLGGLFFCGDKPPQEDTLNGSILNVASVIKNVVASAAESEVGACFQNAQSGTPLRFTLTELGHIQPPTPLCPDNSTVFGILNETMCCQPLEAPVTTAKRRDIDLINVQRKTDIIMDTATQVAIPEESSKGSVQLRQDRTQEIRLLAA